MSGKVDLTAIVNEAGNDWEVRSASGKRNVLKCPCDRDAEMMVWVAQVNGLRLLEREYGRRVASENVLVAPSPGDINGGGGRG